MKENLHFDVENLFEEGNMNIIDTMADIIKIQQQGAIDLTRLVLEHCKDEKITKAYVFDVFNESMNVLSSQFNKNDD